MRKVVMVFAVQLMFLSFVQAQGKIYTKTSTINFDATADMEKIAAVNKKVTAVIDTKSGAMEFAVLMKSFEFEKALMELKCCAASTDIIASNEPSVKGMLSASPMVNRNFPDSIPDT